MHQVKLFKRAKSVCVFILIVSLFSESGFGQCREIISTVASASSTNSRHRGFGKAFTLVELLVSVGVIGTLVAITLPVLSSARASARDVVCKNNLRQCMTSMQVYLQNYKCFPLTETVTKGSLPMLELPKETWLCPADREHPEYELDSSYSYLAPLAMYVNPPDSLEINPKLALIRYERGPLGVVFQDMMKWHGYRNTITFDGRLIKKTDG